MLDFAELFCDDADYGFEYSDEDVQEEDVDIENQYYNSKGTPNLYALFLQAQKKTHRSPSATDAITAQTLRGHQAIMDLAN